MASPKDKVNPSAVTRTERRFDLVDLDPFGYDTAEGLTAFVQRLAGIEDRLRLLRARPRMLTEGFPRHPAGETGGSRSARRPGHSAGLTQCDFSG